MIEETSAARPLRIVVKIGTSTITRPNGSHNLRSMDVLARVLADLKGLGHEVVLVSSGAIGMGAGKLGMAERPTELRMKQAAAAVGQCEMMHIYDKFFGEYGQTVAQILLTEEDVEDPVRTDHLISTFSALLALGAVPIVNENDSVSSSEIERGKSRMLGDNDTLSSIVADLVDADLLVLFSDIDGLYDSDPRKNPSAKLISRVTKITPAMRDAAGGAGSQWGTGGMCTKLDAAMRAMRNGTDMVITNGQNIEALYDIVEGKPVGTRFVADPKAKACPYSL